MQVLVGGGAKSGCYQGNPPRADHWSPKVSVRISVRHNLCDHEIRPGCRENVQIPQDSLNKL